MDRSGALDLQGEVDDKGAACGGAGEAMLSDEDMMVRNQKGSNGWYYLCHSMPPNCHFEDFATPGTYTLILTSIGWVTELQTGHPNRFHQQLGMSKVLFRKLLQELQVSTDLQDSKHVKIEEQLAIFMHFCVTGNTN